MNKENREILLRTIGLLNGLFWSAPEGMKDALEGASDSLEYILEKESEKDNG